jgi:uncharacterized protein YecE (DUF72 family)
MIRVGTSGYSYDDWVGPFYPDHLDKSDRLVYYAREFDATELNFTYYRQPNAWILERIAAKVPDGFLFTVKAFRGLTHERQDNAAEFQTFVDALQPLRDQGKFGCVLAQFPYSFHARPENQVYLRRLRKRFGTLPVVVELRNRDWIAEDTFELLRACQLGFCCVDEPRLKGLLPPIAEVTASVAYVRFHGRNAAKWWQHDEAWERYDYAYSREELEEWVPKIEALDAGASVTYAFANNHWQGQAVDTARQLRMLLA